MKSSLLSPLIKPLISSIIEKQTAQSLWAPSQISPYLWLDASDVSTLTTIGDNVVQWDDKSGNANHASQTSTSRQPLTGIETLNGLNVVSTNNDRPFKIPINITGPFHVFMVYDADNIITNRGFFEFKTPRHAIMTDGIAGHGNDIYTANIPDSGILHTYKPNSIGVEVYFSGVDLSPNTQNSSYTNGSFSELWLFDDSTGGNRLDARIGEVILVNAQLSNSDIEKMDGYLAHKWGMEADLPSGHPYKTSPPEV